MPTTDAYYVYVYMDPRNYEEFYFGKGKGSRKDAHLSDSSDSEKTKRIAAIHKAGLEPIIRVIARNLSEHDALLVEKTLLWKLGRGLTNVSSGHYSENFRPHNTIHTLRYPCDILRPGSDCDRSNRCLAPPNHARTRPWPRRSDAARMAVAVHRAGAGQLQTILPQHLDYRLILNCRPFSTSQAWDPSNEKQINWIAWPPRHDSCLIPISVPARKRSPFL